MQEQTSRATMYGDVALVGVAVFVALALIMATLGSPALSDATPSRADSDPAADDHAAADDAAGPDRAGPDAAGSGHEGSGPADHAGSDHDGSAPDGDDTAGSDHDGHDDEDAPSPAQAAPPTQAASQQTGHDDGHGEGHTGQDADAGGSGAAPGHGASHEDDDDHADDDHDDHDDADAADDDHADHASEHADDDHADHASEHEDDGHDDEDHGDDHDDMDDGHDHADMYAGCDDDHPETQRLRAEVQHSLDHLYSDAATLIAQGYVPYFDTQIPLALATEGVGHWLNPEYIDNGVELDPTRPEAILTDELYQPIGVMFIENADDEDPRPVYVDDDGTTCSPWHPHTDMPARFAWWLYRQAYDGAAYNDGEVMIPEVTPAMMHVWAVDNPAGVYAAHDYPPASSREGPPPRYPDTLRPATPLDEYLTDADDVPVGAEETCPHCPDGEHAGDDDGHDGHQDDEAAGDDRDHDGHTEDADEDRADHDDGHGDDHAEGDDEARDHDGHDYYAGCDEDHPESVALHQAVTHSLDSMYTDVAVLVAKGYVPYPDIILPGITHWLKPPEIYDERVMDPLSPEAVLTDVWHRPVGMMFVEHPEEPAPPVYVDDDGTECYPWHPHTDAPAVFAWNGAEAVYQRNMEYEDETPAMMHVWVDNPHGMYAAHDYPPPSDPPGPLPSYLSNTALQDAVDEPFQDEEADPALEVLYELFARIEEGVLEFNGEPPDLPTG